MGRYFNTEGLCNPVYHYMVRLDSRLRQIQAGYVDRGSYFVINRGRQYGKTTILHGLAEYIRPAYAVISMDFQGIGAEDFASEERFSRAFARMFVEAVGTDCPDDLGEAVKALSRLAEGEPDVRLMKLFEELSDICRESVKPVVLMIDEIDSAANNQVFLDFLSLLRRYYLNREKLPTFYSVILAGVYDIKNLKLKLRPETEHRYNSPWNTREGNEPSESSLSFGDCPRDQMTYSSFDIAARFTLDMNFSANEIAVMLQEYEADHNTGMDVAEAAALIHGYTAGYPYLVSAICKWLDEEISGSSDFAGTAEVWTAHGISEAVRYILDERLSLFDSMMRHLGEYPEMKDMLRLILFQGRRISYNPDHPAINLAAMFGYVVKRDGCVQVANRIYEMRLYQSFLSEEELTNAIGNEAERDRNQFIQDGRLDMERVLERFVENFTDIYGDNEEAFLEAQGRKLFLLYLKPIINGTGNYYVEANTRDARRTDVIVDYRGEQFIVELKIWHGNEYNKRGEAQLSDYLDYYHQTKGYMVSFNFNKKKECGVRTIRIGDKRIVEAVV